ncbi:hypothetical protein LJC52_04065 [Bacteroidales bacterium OttesenSCG-928-A17]|nr:hypothetical protein [Bacteroidales bacterium OttesenSCG-928-A17]
MAIELAYMNLVIPIEKIEKHYPGGFNQYKKDNEGQIVYDDYLVMKSAMDMEVIESFAKECEGFGLVGVVEKDGVKQWQDFCIVDIVPTLPCSWLGHNGPEVYHIDEVQPISHDKANIVGIELSSLGVGDINSYFEEIDSFNGYLKEQLLSVSESENQTPQKIEQLLKTHYYSWRRLNVELIRLLLEERRFLLNKSFEFTPKNIENLLRVNRILSEGSQKVMTKSVEMARELQNREDNFTDYYEISGTVRVLYDGNDSLIDFDPEHDEDELSDCPHIMEIISSAMSSRYREDLFFCYPSKNGDPYGTPLYADDPWNRNFNSRPEFAGIRFSWAFHNLVDHTLYALQDVVRINDFWNEVTVIHQNLDGKERIID